VTGLVNLTSIGSGTDHKFITPTIDTAQFNPTGTTAHRDAVVDLANDTIALGVTTGLHTGDQVTYNAEGNTAIGGLNSGNSYFVRVQNNGTFKFYTSQANANA